MLPLRARGVGGGADVEVAVHQPLVGQGAHARRFRHGGVRVWRQAHQQLVAFHTQAQLAVHHEHMAAEHALFLDLAGLQQRCAHGVDELQGVVGQRAGRHGGLGVKRVLGLV